MVDQYITQKLTEGVQKHSMQLNHLFSLNREEIWNPASVIATEGVRQKFVVVWRVGISFHFGGSLVSGRARVVRLM